MCSRLKTNQELTVPQFNIAGATAPFDPETVAILSAALEDAWQNIQASGDTLSRPAYANAAREVIAKHIIEMAQRGERDPIKLREGALRYLATNYRA
jgi:tartrate dehydratase beta subunit/fumarate hydratase class I family protein